MEDLNVYSNSCFFVYNVKCCITHSNAWDGKKYNCPGKLIDIDGYKIHLNEKGYAVWTWVIKPILLNDLCCLLSN